MSMPKKATGKKAAGGKAAGGKSDMPPFLQGKGGKKSGGSKKGK